MSEFEKAFTDSYGHNIDDPDEHIIFACKGLADDIWQHQQAKIDELQKKYDAMYNAFTVADDCRKEWHESYMSARKERDELQARIDELQEHSLMLREAAKSWFYNEGEKNILISQADDLDRILKGNKDEN